MLQSNSRPDRTSTKVFDSTFPPSFPPRRCFRGQTGKAASGQFKFQFDDDLIHRQPKWHTMADKPISGPGIGKDDTRGLNVNSINQEE